MTSFWKRLLKIRFTPWLLCALAALALYLIVAHQGLDVNSAAYRGSDSSLVAVSAPAAKHQWRQVQTSLPSDVKTTRKSAEVIALPSAQTSASAPPALIAAVNKARYAFEPIRHKGRQVASHQATDYRAQNPRHGLTAHFDAHGVLVQTPNSSPLRLSWYSLVRGDKTQAIAPARLSQSGDTLTLQRAGVTEWFRNTTQGLEQGFTLRHRPAGQGDEVQLRLKADGLRAQNAKGHINLVDSSGHPALTYSKLKVWDARGKVLPSRMKVQKGRILLALNDRDACYPLTVDPLLATQQAHLTADDGVAHDVFGISVALSGDTAVVGAYRDPTSAGEDAGVVYVFTRIDGAWTQQAKLTANDGALWDSFGRSVAISGDTVLVGAYRADTGGGSDAGAAYVFTRSNGTWQQESKLTAADGAAADFFGVSVALSGDTALIGTFRSDAAGEDAGAAYLFTRGNGSWSQGPKLTASDGAEGDLFGYSVALFGNAALVGAYGHDTTAGEDAGAVYVFSQGSGSWAQDAKLTAEGDGAGADYFGFAVALSSDTALVGAYCDDTSAGIDAGSAYVFTRSNGVWAPDVKLTTNDGDAYDSFGASVALSGDNVLIGAYGDDASGGEDAGSAYVFIRANGTWAQETKYTPADGAASDLFGYSVSLSGDTSLVGSFLDDTGAGIDGGSAYIFTLTPMPTVSIGDANIAEGPAPGATGGNVTIDFPVTLSATAVQAVVLDYSTGDDNASVGTDYIGVTHGTVTIPAGQSSGKISITVKSDDIVETDETFHVTLNTASKAIIGIGVGIGTILNDDFARVKSITRLDTNPTTAPSVKFSVVFNTPVTGVDTGDFTLTQADGLSGGTVTDVTGSGTTYTVTIGDYTGAGTLRLDVTDDDSIVDGINNKELGGTGTTGDANGSFTAGEVYAIQVPVVSIADAAANEGNTGTSPLLFTISLSQASVQTITVSATTVDGTAVSTTDYTALPNTTVTFAPGDLTKTVEVSLQGNIKTEANKTFTINLFAPSHATLRTATATATGTILNDDFTPVANNQNISAQEDTAKTIALTATDANVGDVLILKITSLPTNGTLYDGADATTPITTASPATPYILTAVATAKDKVYYVPAANYNGPDSFTFNATDGTNISETAIISLAVAEINDAPVAVSDTLANIAEDSGNYTIPFATLTGNDSPGPANEIAQTLTIASVSSIVGGTVNIVGQNVVFAPTLDFHGAAHFDYVVQDNGTTAGLPDAKTASAMASFSITPVNDAPIVVDGAATGNEDTDISVDLRHFVGDVETATADLTYSPGTPGTGTLTATQTPGLYIYRGSQDYNGVATFTYFVTDRGDPDGTPGNAKTSNTSTITITIHPVNDPPTFFKGNDQVIIVTTNEQSVPGWAGVIKPGPDTAGDEAEQTSDFILSNDNNALFTVQPFITADGTLHYTPAGQMGIATVTVQLQDGGGLDNGGQDSDAVQTFTITITEAPSLIVTTPSDTSTNIDGLISLREAITYANLHPGSDTITFDSTVFLVAGPIVTITLASELPSLSTDIRITGPGANVLTVSGNNAIRVFSVASGATGSISNLSIINGLATNGGGISNHGTLLVTSCTLSGNTATATGGALYSEDASLTVTSSTLNNNRAARGGGLFSQTDLSGTHTTTIRNSTLSGNTASERGGGLYNAAGLTRIENSTLTLNSAPEGAGSGMASVGNTLTRTEAANSIIAGNTASDVDFVAFETNSFQSNGYNLLGTGNATGTFSNNDQVRNTNPSLGPLDLANGGATATHALLPGSRAVNNGNPAFDGIGKTDQRGKGFPRVRGGRLDVGAYEVARPPQNLSLSPNSGTSVVGVARTFTARYADPDGLSDLAFVELQINSDSNGVNGMRCYYDPNSNKLYLRNDANTAWLGAIAPGTKKLITNSQGSINCETTTVEMSGSIITVKWSVIPADKWKHTRQNLYMFARDKGDLTAGWDLKGTWDISVSTAPLNVSLTPGSGTSLSGVARTFTSKYADPGGTSDLASVELLIGSDSGGANTIRCYYDPINNKLYLRNDANTAWLGATAPGSNVIVSNSQGSLSCKDTSFSTDGNTLTVNWSITPNAKWAKTTQNLYLFVKDKTNQTDGWDAMGTWSIGASTAPVNESVTPGDSSSAVGAPRLFTSKYSDPDGAGSIAFVELQINSDSSGINGMRCYYDPNSNKLYLRNDANTTWLGAVAPGTNVVVSNSQGSLNIKDISFATEGNTLTVNWSVTPKAKWVNTTQNIYLFVKDKTNQSDGWDNLGLWHIVGASTLPTPAGSPITAPPTPANGTASGSASSVTLIFTDATATQSAQKANDFTVKINGAKSTVQTVTRNGAVIALLLPEGSMKAGDTVSVAWNSGVLEVIAE